VKNTFGKAMIEFKQGKFFRKPSEIVAEMEGELSAIREQVNLLKTMKSFNDVPDDIKAELRILFRMTSGKYLFEYTEPTTDKDEDNG